MLNVELPVLNPGDTWAAFKQEDVERWLGVHQRLKAEANARLRETVLIKVRESKIVAALEAELARRQKETPQ